MSRKFKLKNKKFGAALFNCAAIAVSCVMLAACAGGSSPSGDDEDDSATSKKDTQLLKNGNFEFFDDNDGVYLISNPDNWSSSYNGTQSDSMSGIINTGKTAWDRLTDDTLSATLEANNDLDSSNSDKVDYNGMLTDDIPYKNTHAATDDEDEEGDKDYIANPFTHNLSYEGGVYRDENGDEVTVYEDENGKLYSDSEMTESMDSNVLMIHNYVEDNYHGTESYFTSSTTLTLAAHTAAKISVWVKTSDLFYQNSAKERSEVTQERGAYIKVSQSVGGNSLDDFVINKINTERLYTNYSGTEIADAMDKNNGWVQYTVYVNACDFAETTLTVTLGLGEDGGYTAEGYAFFDDVTYEIYKDVDALQEKYPDLELSDEDFPSCSILSQDEEKIFRTDVVKVNTDKGEQTFESYSQNFEYFIDLENNEDKTDVLFADAASAGLTVDKTDNNRKYTASKTFNGKTVGLTALDNGYANAFLPTDFAGTGIGTSSDVLACVTVNSNGVKDADTIFGGQSDRISKALENLLNLPGTGAEEQAVVMLSVEGAPYVTEFSDETLFSVDAEGYKIVSFWIKTHDMDGNTAATVTVEELNTAPNKENTASFTIDTNTVDQTNIGNKNDADSYEEDIYDGWVQCFIFVENQNETEAKEFKISVNFGNTAFTGSSKSSYYGGWVAVANMQVTDVTEEIFGYTGGLNNTATLTIANDEDNTSDYFDSEYQSGNNIETGIARPSSYTGVNGASLNTHSSDSAASALTAYDKPNDNAFAGLINKKYFSEYADEEWFKAINAKYTADWKTFAGSYSAQPLLIVNGERSIEGKDSGVYNYGYYGSSTTLSAGTYTAISVRVKVSAGAVANVYLVDADTNKVLSLTTPAYTFWYDDKGNVLFGEEPEKATDAQKVANIAYKYRESDGLYEREGNLYANIYSLTRQYYNTRNSDLIYYDYDGNAYTYRQIKEGVDYYTDANHTDYAPHYLVTDGDVRVYSYISGSGIEDPAYNYFVNDKIDKSYTIHGFDTELVTPRYVYDGTGANPYQVTIDGNDSQYADKWITVRFIIATGNEDKNYRLELWSGERDSEQTDGVAEGSYVLFDYCPPLTLEATDFDERRQVYLDYILEDYMNNLPEGTDDKNGANLAYYEGLGDYRSELYNYTAQYYKFTLYDSSAYYPFNSNTADDEETGYNFTYSDDDEILAFFKVTDLAEGEIGVYVDYNAIDQEVSVGRATDVDSEDDTSTSLTDGTNFWLLFASILLVAAIILVLVVILVKDLMKSIRRKKTVGKNSYNFHKNSRYVRTYLKANGDIDIDEIDESQAYDEDYVDDSDVEDVENADSDDSDGETEE